MISGRECTKTFKNSHSLAKHNLIHKKECLVKCEVCQRQFLTERRLRNHVAAVHEKLRPFQCSHCEFTSARKDELKLHVRAHTGMFSLYFLCNAVLQKSKIAIFGVL